MPGLLQHQENLESTLLSSHPEDSTIWLPSQIPAPLRLQVCHPELPEIEEQIRTAQCYDALNAICHVLKLKAQMVMFKNKNICGQRNGMQSCTVIDRVYERVRVVAEKYRAVQHAKYALAGEGEWEEVLHVLQDGNIRG
jgi:hypothetical protein